MDVNALAQPPSRWLPGVGTVSNFGLEMGPYNLTHRAEL